MLKRSGVNSEQWITFLSRHERKILLTVFLIGILVRLPFLPYDHRVVIDMTLFREWSRTLNQQGITVLFESATDTLYLPVGMYPIALAGFIEEQMPETLRYGDQALNFFIKLFHTSADFITAVFLVYALRGQPAHRRVLAFMLYILNPAVWYISIYFGQSDSIYAFFLVATFVTLSHGPNWLAWVLYALALATKPQSILLAPLIFFVTWKMGTPKLLKGGITAAITGVFVSLPFLLNVNLITFIKGVTKSPADVNVSAYNLWYLLRWGDIHRISVDLIPFPFLPLSYGIWGLGFYGGFVLLVIGIMWWHQKTQKLILPAILLSMAPYMLLPGMHERYLLPALPLVLLAAAGWGGEQTHHRLWWVYGLLTLTFYFNLVTVASFAPQWWTNIAAQHPPYPLFIAILKGGALMVSAVHVLIFGWLTLCLARNKLATSWQQPKTEFFP